MPLSDLKQRYFGSVASHDEGTEIEFLVDGRRYLAALSGEIEQKGPGDRVYRVDWFFDPKLGLHGRSAGDSGCSGATQRVHVVGHGSRMARHHRR